MKTRLFVTLPFISHFYPIMSYAKSIRQENDKFVFTGLEYQRNFIEQNNFIFHEFNYLKTIKIYSFKTFLKVFIYSANLKLISSVKARDFLAFKISCENLFNQFSPDEIFIDEHLIEYYWFFAQFNSKITILNTKLSTKKSKGIPPLNSLFVPRNNFFSNLVCEILWYKNFLRLKGIFLIEYLAYLGKSDDYFLNKISSKHGFSRRGKIDYNNSFYPTIKGVDTIILAPLEIEFPFKHLFENETYVWENKIRDEFISANYSYLNILQRLENIKAKNPSMKIIYISFGTISVKYRTQIEKFLNILIEISSLNSSWILLISEGNIKLNINFDKQVFILPYFPQQDVLKKVNLFITHCGLGSIKEAFFEKKPLLLVPLNSKSDQFGNTSRMLFLGNSEYLNLNRYSKDEIIEKINRLLKKTVSI